LISRHNRHHIESPIVSKLEYQVVRISNSDNIFMVVVADNVRQITVCYIKFEPWRLVQHAAKVRTRCKFEPLPDTFIIE